MWTGEIRSLSKQSLLSHRTQKRQEDQPPAIWNCPCMTVQKLLQWYNKKTHQHTTKFDHDCLLQTAWLPFIKRFRFASELWSDLQQDFVITQFLMKSCSSNIHSLHVFKITPLASQILGSSSYTLCLLSIVRQLWHPANRLTDIFCSQNKVLDCNSSYLWCWTPSWLLDNLAARLTCFQSNSWESPLYTAKPPYCGDAFSHSAFEPCGGALQLPA